MTGQYFKLFFLRNFNSAKMKLIQYTERYLFLLKLTPGTPGGVFRFRARRKLTSKQRSTLVLQTTNHLILTYQENFYPQLFFHSTLEL